MKNRSPSRGRAVCANPHCRRRAIHARGRCQACFSFLKRHGRDITRGEMRARRAVRGQCKNCHGRPLYARGRCKRCYQYQRRTGRERVTAGQKSEDGLCRNCGQRPPYRLGRCRSCYAYLSLHHQDRVED